MRVGKKGKGLPPGRDSPESYARALGNLQTVLTL